MAAATTPAFTAQKDMSQTHTIALFVSDKPGVLVRVALVFSRRSYNIESLVVSPAKDPGYSRMTITCSGDPATLGQIIKQLAKLVDVLHAIDHTGEAIYETEIALIKIETAGNEERAELMQIAEHFGARVVDYGSNSTILRVYGNSEKLDALIRLLNDMTITELVRSGKMVMARGRATT
ncbi:MAG: acetolactate synthase small subunit [Myxococcota bacterium]|nr:acetolactate synthase small subunit [Myxococcota bacterium]